MKKVFYILFVVAFFALAFKPGTKTVSFTIEPVFNTETIVLNSKKYVNANGDSLTIEAFRFYLSNFIVYHRDKKPVHQKLYYLIDAEKDKSLKFGLKDLPDGKIDSLSFCIGVDSLMSVSGALDGDLDPTLGMFWAWNTGYINAKLEGKSSSCKTIHNAYEFHVGGYLKPYNALRKVTLVFKGEKFDYKIKANAAVWFNGKEKIKLAEMNSVVMPGKQAMIVADNYSNMFSVAE